MGYLRKIERVKVKKFQIKKSQDLVSFFFVLVVLFGAAIVFLVLNKAWADMKPSLDEGISSAIPSNSNVNITKTLDSVTSTVQLFDKLLPFLMIGLFAFVLIVAGGFMQHPIMIFVGVIIFGVTLMLAVIYSNVYSNISDADEFATAKADLPITDKFMQYLPIIIFIMAIGIGAAIIWSRRSGGGL